MENSAGYSEWAPRPTRSVPMTPNCTAWVRSCWQPARCPDFPRRRGASLGADSPVRGTITTRSKSRDAMQTDLQDSRKLYRKIALAISAAIADGRYGPGEKLPSERELADSFGVSRPTIRDAMIALEFQGLVEARRGSGVYVNASPPVPEDAAELEVNALEWTEARRLFEGEACALLAAIAREEHLSLLDRLANEMAGDPSHEAIERLEQEFHRAIA